MTNFNHQSKESNYIVILSDQGLVLDANAKLKLLLGQGIIGKSIASFSNETDKEEIIAWLKMIKMGAVNVNIIEFNTRDKPKMSLEGTYSSHTNSFICTLTHLNKATIKANEEVEKHTENLQLSEVVNKELFQSLMDDFYNLTGVPIGIIDLTGKIIVAEGWQDICTKFHRIHPETNKNCKISDIELTTGIKRGEFRQYKCKNNMWDIATPIYIGRKLKGHIFIGQFFYDDEEIDLECFRDQAQEYGFDENAYLEAVKSVPRFSREQMRLAMSFYSKLADIIAELSYSNAKLIKTNEVLENTNSFNQTLLDAIPSPVFYKDTEGKYLGFNDAFNDVIEDADTIALGKTTYDVHPHEKAKYYADLDKKLFEGMGEQIYETSVTYSNGTIHEIQFHKAVFFDNLGKVAGLIGVMLDITNQKHVEEELIASKENLEHLVEDRTSELVAANEELIALNEELTTTLENLKMAQQQLILSEKMAALGSLVAGLSHEISTPMGNSYTSVTYVGEILSTLENKYKNNSMSTRDFEEFIKDLWETITIAERNLERAHHLLNSFKTMAIDQTNNEWRTFNVHDYISDLIFSLEPLTKPKNCSVYFNCPDMLSISGYPGVLAQILTNLFTNTIHHAFENDKNRLIEINFSESNGSYILDYKDNGVGMTEEVVKHAFEPFYTTKRGEAGGTGLGLHLVYNLVTQRLGGTILLESELDKGTHFKIEFPEYIQER